MEIKQFSENQIPKLNSGSFYFNFPNLSHDAVIKKLQLFLRRVTRWLATSSELWKCSLVRLVRMQVFSSRTCDLNWPTKSTTENSTPLFNDPFCFPIHRKINNVCKNLRIPERFRQTWPSSLPFIGYTVNSLICTLLY